MQALLVLAIVGSLVACKLTNSFWPLAFGGVILAIALLTKLRPSLPSLAFLKSGWFWSALGVVVITGVAFWWWNQPPPAPTFQTLEWRFKVEVPPYLKHHKDMVPGDYPATITISHGEIIIVKSYREKGSKEVCTYHGKSTGNGFYEGTWFQANPRRIGQFTLRFFPEGGGRGTAYEDKPGERDKPFDIILYRR